MIIKKKENIVSRNIHGTPFLIDIFDRFSDDKCAIYELNETGMFLWNSIDGINSVEDLAELLKNAIVDDVDYNIIYADVVEFINSMMKRKFVEVL